MIRQFVPTEFYVASLSSWLSQFKYAMRMTKTHPNVALAYLVDTDYDRWKTICSKIENIDEVAAAIRFLDDSLDMKKGCCTPQHRKIERTIQVVKLAALPRRDAEAKLHIDEIKSKISKLVRTERIMNALIRRLNHNIERLRNKHKSLRNKHKMFIEQADRVSQMMRKIVEMEQSRRQTMKKIKSLNTDLNVWTRYRDTLRPYAEQ